MLDAAPYKTLFNFGNIDVFEMQLNGNLTTELHPFLESEKWCHGSI